MSEAYAWSWLHKDISVFHCLRKRECIEYAHFISVFHCQYARRYLVMRRALWLLYVAGKQGQCNVNGTSVFKWTNTYKTHYSDNKVKIELQTMSWKTDWAEMVSKIKIYTRWKRRRNKCSTICNKLVLPCNTDKCM